ncbi:hypothetical protein LTS15_005587 [Exophiala xenobiotica]|nr:hypothetical protein LTS15_005587 [Exophiala xenobiotica]
MTATSVPPLPDAWLGGSSQQGVQSDGPEFVTPSSNYWTSDNDHLGTPATDAWLFGLSSQQGVQGDGVPASDKKYTYINDSATSDTTYDTGGNQTPVSSNKTSLGDFFNPTLADAGHQTQSIAEGAVLNDTYAGASFELVLNDINPGASFELVGGATTVITEARNKPLKRNGRFICPDQRCPYETPKKFNIDRHLESKKAGENPVRFKFQCPYCRRWRSTVHRFNEHVQSHHACRDCGKTFKTKTDLLKHGSTCPGPTRA